MSEAQWPSWRRVAMARTSSASIVSAVLEDPSRRPRIDRLFDVQEGHHVEQLLDLQGVDMLLDLEDARHLGGQPVVAAPLAAAVPPLGQTDDGIGPTALGQEQVCQGRAARPPSGDGRNRSPGAE